MKRWLVSTTIAVAIGATFASSASAQAKGQSKTCGPANGKTQGDIDHVLAFCEKGIPIALKIQSASAMDMFLWLKVSRPLADTMMADRLTTEQLVKTWMTVWKATSGSPSVTIRIEWGDIEIAKGETTFLHGDQVTIKAR